MRTVSGSVALTLGLYLALSSAVAVSRPDLMWLAVACGCLAVLLFATSYFILRPRAVADSRRWLVIVPSVAVGFAGLVIAATSVNSSTEAWRDGKYKWTLSVFGHAVAEDNAPAAERPSRWGEGTIIGPSRQLETKQQLFGLGIFGAFVLLSSCVGAATGEAIRRLIRSR